MHLDGHRARGQQPAYTLDQPFASIAQRQLNYSGVGQDSAYALGTRLACFVGRNAPLEGVEC